MKNKEYIYQLEITTENPSADNTYFFSTLKLAENKKQYWINVVREDIKKHKKDEEYYYSDRIEKCLFTIEEILIDE